MCVLLSVARSVPVPDAEAEADAEADPQYYGGHPVAFHTGPAPNCTTEDVILITQACRAHPEEVCSTETVDTQEIEYEKVCKEIVDTLCDAAPYHHGKREAEAVADANAEAEADPQYYSHSAPLAAAAPVAVAHHAAPVAVAHHAAPVAVAHHVAPAPVAHAVAHSVTATVKHACREVTTEHCVDNPKVKEVPVEVEHCHTVTKVTCTPVENKLPMTTCEAVVTTATQHAAIPVAAPVAPVAHAGYGHGVVAHAGY